MKRQICLSYRAKRIPALLLSFSRRMLLHTIQREEPSSLSDGLRLRSMMRSSKISTLTPALRMRIMSSTLSPACSPACANFSTACTSAGCGTSPTPHLPECDIVLESVPELILEREARERLLIQLKQVAPLSEPKTV